MEKNIQIQMRDVVMEFDYCQFTDGSSERERSLDADFLNKQPERINSVGFSLQEIPRPTHVKAN